MSGKGLLDAARGELGSAERPAGSNRTKYGAWYGLDGNPWCMMFIQWCCAQAGAKLPLRTASCGALMNAAKQSGSWVSRDFRPGDVVIYDFSGRKRAAEHCGIVEEVLADGVSAIEGNTSEAGSQSNGGMVCRKKRRTKYIMGAVRPACEEEDDTMTGKEIYDALSEYLGRQPLPAWAREELEEAVRLGVTDGSAPLLLISRYQAAIMAKRAARQGRPVPHEED